MCAAEVDVVPRIAASVQTRGMTELRNASVLGRLLEEISWEGSLVKGYRDGGRGREERSDG
jgi:hypothetical protein